MESDSVNPQGIKGDIILLSRQKHLYKLTRNRFACLDVNLSGLQGFLDINSPFVKGMNNPITPKRTKMIDIKPS